MTSRRVGTLCVAVALSLLCAATAAGKPSPPTNVQASEGLPGHIVVTWNWAPDVTFLVYRSSTGPFGSYSFRGYGNGDVFYDWNIPPKTLAKPKITSTTTTLANRIDLSYQEAVIATEYYHYKVKAQDMSGTSDDSNLTIGWADDRIDPNSTHILVASSLGGGYSMLAPDQPNAGSYSHTGLPDGVTRWYKLLLVTAAGYFIESSAVSGATAPGLPPPGPTSVTISGPSTRQTLEWGTWYASVGGGVPPYSYDWEVRDYGTFIWYPAGGGGSSLDFRYDIDFELRVTATDANGYSKSSAPFLVMIEGGPWGPHF